MIVRRITAGAAGFALAATAFAAAPAMAKTNTTVIKLDSSTIDTVGLLQIKPEAVKPAKLKKGKLTVPAKLKGKYVTHKGGLKLTNGTAFLTVENIKLNYKNGKASATVDNSVLGAVEVPNVLTFKGGKNTIKKNGKWKNAKVALAPKVNVPPLGEVTTAFVLGTVFGVDEATIEQFLPAPISIGKATIIVKKKK